MKPISGRERQFDAHLQRILSNLLLSKEKRHNFWKEKMVEVWIFLQLCCSFLFGIFVSNVLSFFAFWLGKLCYELNEVYSAFQGVQLLFFSKIWTRKQEEIGATQNTYPKKTSLEQLIMGLRCSYSQGSIYMHASKKCEGRMTRNMSAGQCKNATWISSELTSPSAIGNHSTHFPD